ncbi:hypothetical protein R69919_00356 [Paraburkholderia gardini]|nr:hypothetical protein R69919_00356 [Paraburkholderia gardini]
MEETSGTNSPAMHDFLSPGGGSLTNNGKLSTSGDNSAGMAALTSDDTLVNNGTITTTGAGSHGLLANGGAAGGPGNNVVTNNGTIDVSGANAHGITSLDSSPGVVTNTGSIAASGPGGLGAFIAGRVTLDNAAGASIVSQQDNGIDANGGGTFNNAGTISGRNVALSLVGAAATINNSGTLQGASRRPLFRTMHRIS